MGVSKRSRWRRWGFFLAAALATAGAAAGWFNTRRTETRRLLRLLDEARSEVSAGRFNSARVRLVDLSASRPDWGEVPYLLGLCEQGRGRIDGALRAWGSVRDDSPFAGLAAVRLARAEMSRGRLSEAEDLLVKVVDRPGGHALEARQSLVLLYRFQGRRASLRRLARGAIGEPGGAPARDKADVVETLRLLWSLDHDPYPVAAVRAYLDEVGRDAPDDDRVWLGRAWLALRAGRYDEAVRWLDACLRRRPYDPDVWRARLDWARETGRRDDALACFARIPVPDDPESRFEARSEALALRAWFAARRDDRDAEREALTRRVALVPGDLSSLERLVELAAVSGLGEEAAALRQRKDALDRTRAAYAEAIGRDDPAAHADELARLAQELGMNFEARWWLRLTPGSGPAPPVVASAPGPQTLADLLPDLLVTQSPPPPPPRRPRVSPVRFEDAAQFASLNFVFDQGQTPLRHLPETMSGGVGLVDYDSDGYLDVYCLQGGPFPPSKDSPGDRLFRNRGDGTFEDVTERSGIAVVPRGYGHGIAVGDVDNDGAPDLFVTRWRSYALYRNRGDGTFEDVTERWGLGGDRDWPTSAAFADLDNDGDLDLYVAHYLAWDPDHARVCEKAETGARYYCTPAEFPSTGDHVFRNDGGRFTDVSESSGVRASDVNGRGLGVVAADLDDDGRVDLYVANDMSANFLFHNLGGFRFEEVGHAWGVATGGGGGNLAGMGIACGDVDADGRPDLVVTNFFGEGSSFYHNLGGGLFADHARSAGLFALTRDLLGFGVALIDADNDGRLDLLTANGHVNDGRPQFPWAMPTQFLLGTPDGRFADGTPQAGAALTTQRVGRGLAVGDLDNDGRLDAVVVSQGEPLALLRNTTPHAGGHFLTLSLEGKESNRDGVGARVTVRAGGGSWSVRRCGGGSYLSASDPRLHVGLGLTSAVESVEVRWPSGRVDRFESLSADIWYRLREGSRRAEPVRRDGPVRPDRQ